MRDIAVAGACALSVNTHLCTLLSVIIMADKIAELRALVVSVEPGHDGNAGKRCEC